MSENTAIIFNNLHGDIGWIHKWRKFWKKHKQSFAAGAFICAIFGSIILILRTEKNGLQIATETTPETTVTKWSKCMADMLPHRCIYPEESGRIRGGTVTGIKEHTSIVQIIYALDSGGRDARCGGTLITNLFVLTAAHCFHHPDGELDSVHVGPYDLSREPGCTEEDFKNGKCSTVSKEYDILEIYEHPNYDHNFFHDDIGLIQLTEKVLFTKYNEPACLPQPNFEMTKDMMMWIVGFGAKDPNKLEGTMKRQAVDVKLFDFKKCKRKFKSIQPVRQFCAGGEEGKDTCKGDSGGPVLFKYLDSWLVVGITSFGYRTCGTKGWPGVYTNVTHYVDWILKTISDNACN